MPHRFENISKISTYKVDKELIEDIENYYRVQIPQILSINQPLYDQFSVTVYSKSGNETYKSINDYGYPLFQNHTKSITVELSLKDKYRGIVIHARFDRNCENSFVHICLYDERGIEILEAIKSKLIKIMSAKKSMNCFLYPRDFLLFPLLIIGLFIGLFGFLSGVNDVRPICKILLIVLLAYIGIFRFMKGYCTFDSLWQKRVDNFLNWIFLGIAGFILTCFLTPIGKKIFGV